MDKVINIFKWIVSFLMVMFGILILDQKYSDLCWAVGFLFFGWKLFESTLPKYERYVRD
jgi:hypothetical protein|tara:strand:- start:1331 stop:1507 length:177 start_codon:yes stop_codon:yes gene_type:complete